MQSSVTTSVFLLSIEDSLYPKGYRYKIDIKTGSIQKLMGEHFNSQGHLNWGLTRDKLAGDVNITQGDHVIANYSCEWSRFCLSIYLSFIQKCFRLYLFYTDMLQTVPLAFHILLTPPLKTGIVSSLEKTCPVSLI